MSWTSAMVNGLLEARSLGERDFGRAWRYAQRRAPNRPRDFIARPDDVVDPGWLPFSTFFRHACEAEWNGLAVADYAGLRELLTAEVVDEARSPGRERAVLLG